ncbi:MAG: biotin transporter BioY [Rhodovibrionaceae bacterium]|nr:biotin transporter BioY [Rhodovibrionaceae bacterium]
MNTSFDHSPVLSQVLWPADDRAGRILRGVILAIVGSLLLTASAKVKVPFYPVEMTMQTFVVLVLAAAYGWRLGVATVLLYLAQGAAGLPVFTGTPEKGLGLAYMAGPTAGYLGGFIIAAFIVGWLAEHGWTRRIARTALSMAVGTLAFFVPGVIWLSVLFGFDKAIAFGVTPFLLSEPTKVALAVFFVHGMWYLIKRET